MKKTFNNNRKIVTFKGNGEAKREDSTITLRKLLLYYNDQQRQKPEEKEELKIDIGFQIMI